MALMRVFHGGYQPVPEPRIIVGRNTKDFGPGFYCTILREKPSDGQDAMTHLPSAHTMFASTMRSTSSNSRR